MWVYFHKKLISKTRLVDLIKVNASIAKVDVVKFDVSIFLLSYLILHKWVYFHKNWYQSSRLVNLMEVNASISKVDVIEIGMSHPKPQRVWSMRKTSQSTCRFFFSFLFDNPIHKIISSSNIKNYHTNSIEYTLRVSQNSK